MGKRTKDSEVPASSKRSEPGTGERSEEEAGTSGEVLAKPARRRFTAEYKLRILREIDETEPGQAGAILRREGLYSSHLTDWRRAREAGALKGLSKKRGRKGKSKNPLQGRVDQLERQLARTQEKLRKAELILEVQGKVSELLGIDLKSGKDS